MSYTFITTFSSTGILYSIVVTGLKGLGKLLVLNSEFSAVKFSLSNVPPSFPKTFNSFLANSASGFSG
jgi:hypothetical protein